MTYSGGEDEEETPIAGSKFMLCVKNSSGVFVIAAGGRRPGHRAFPSDRRRAYCSDWRSLFADA